MNFNLTKKILGNPAKGNAVFVAAMEDVLDVYHLPYGLKYPVVCMDESSKQLIGEVRESIPEYPGKCDALTTSSSGMV